MCFDSFSTLTSMWYLWRMLVRRAIMAPGRKGRQQLSPLSWATLQPRIQGTKVAQRPGDVRTYCHWHFTSVGLISQTHVKHLQMPQSSQQSHTFELQSDNPEDTVYCVTETWGCELITFDWNAIAASGEKKAVLKITKKSGLLAPHRYPALCPVLRFCLFSFQFKQISW